MAAKRILMEDEREVANTPRAAQRTRAGAKRQTGSAGYSGANAVAFGIGAFCPRDAALTERDFKRAPVLRKRSERDMVISPISLYVPFVAALLSSPLGAQLSAAPLPINLQMNECVLALADADKLIDETADPSRTEAAKKQLEIARNMMDQHDAQGCMTHADNAVRAMK